MSDLYLTTSPIAAGAPGTPYAAEPPAHLRLAVEKAGHDGEAGVVFEHFVVDRDAEA